MSSSINVKELLNSGIHYGHHAGRWNPKMKQYIYGKRNSLHIIDIKETIRGLLLAKKYLAKTVSEGKDVVFVGTKRQAQKCIKTRAESVGMHWVTERWIGGTLTNFREIRKRVSHLNELEKMEEEGTMDFYSKKEGARLRRELRKVRRNLGGIRNMTSQPGAMVVIDPSREIIAVREARKIGIPVIALIDTESDPDVVDIPIPGNDDAMKAIELVTAELVSAVEEGIKNRAVRKDEDEEEKPKRRSQRPTTARADEIPDAVPYKEEKIPADENETDGDTETSEESEETAESAAGEEQEDAPDQETPEKTEQVQDKV